MLKKKSLAVATAVLLASAMAIEPAFAQDGNHTNDNDRYNQDQQQYNQNQQQYDQQRGQYDQQRNQYDQQRDQYDRDQSPNRGREDYDHNYRADQDAYSRDCGQQRANNQVGGLIVGAIAGGLLGSTVAHGPARGSGTAIGAILGGALGANIGGNLSCEDRGYVYHTYYDGFERGRTNVTYRWRNPQSGNYGEFVVRDYYQDRDGFRCAHYTQTIYIHGRPVPARGEACRQGDGNWAVID